MQRSIGFGRAIAALALLAGLTASVAAGQPAAASETTVTIHKSRCSTTAQSYFDECHGNVLSGIGFTIAGRALVTNGSGVTGTAVAPGKVAIAEGAAYRTDGGQFIYCSNPDTGRVLYGDHRTGGSISIKVKAGEHVVCDWFNLVKPQPKGVTITVHAFWCPANTSGDIFTACHKSKYAKAGVFFFAFTGNHGVQDDANSKGTATLKLATDSTGKVNVQVEEELGAITKHGAFVFCSSNGHSGSGNVLGGKTVYDGVINIKVKDGSKVTCDWYNLTP
jgi:hypothetical protein